MLDNEGMEAITPRRPGRPRTAQGRLIQIRLPADLEAAIEAYRASLRPIPDRGAAILELIRRGVSSHAQASASVPIKPHLVAK